MFCQRVSEFFLLALCLSVGGGGGVGIRFSTSPSVKKITDPPPINKGLVPITKSPKGHYVADLFLRYFLYFVKYISNAVKLQIVHEHVSMFRSNSKDSYSPVLHENWILHMFAFAFLRTFMVNRPRGYKTFFMLNNIKEFGIF